MKASTMRELLVQAEETWGDGVVIRYKSGKGTVAEKSYTDLRKDSEHFSDLLETLKVRGGHVALIGPTSYEWILSYFGTVNSGSVAVPLVHPFRLQMSVNLSTVQMQWFWWQMKQEKMCWKQQESSVQSFVILFPCRRQKMEMASWLCRS